MFSKGVDGIKRVFDTTFQPFVAARRMGMVIINQVPYVKVIPLLSVLFWKLIVVTSRSLWVEPWKVLLSLCNMPLSMSTSHKHSYCRILLFSVFSFQFSVFFFRSFFLNCWVSYKLSGSSVLLCRHMFVCSVAGCHIDTGHMMVIGCTTSTSGKFPGKPTHPIFTNHP